MYGWSRIDEDFCNEVGKFIEAAEKHALTLTHYKDIVICPYKVSVFFPRGVTPTSKFVCVLPFPDGDARRHKGLS